MPAYYLESPLEMYFHNVHVHLSLKRKRHCSMSTQPTPASILRVGLQLKLSVVVIKDMIMWRWYRILSLWGHTIGFPHAVVCWSTLNDDTGGGARRNNFPPEQCLMTSPPGTVLCRNRRIEGQIAAILVVTMTKLIRNNVWAMSIQFNHMGRSNRICLHQELPFSYYHSFHC